MTATLTEGQRVRYKPDGALGTVQAIHPSGIIEVEWDDTPGQYDFFEPSGTSDIEAVTPEEDPEDDTFVCAACTERHDIDDSIRVGGRKGELFCPRCAGEDE